MVSPAPDPYQPSAWGGGVGPAGGGPWRAGDPFRATFAAGGSGDATGRPGTAGWPGDTGGAAAGDTGPFDLPRLPDIPTGPGTPRLPIAGQPPAAVGETFTTNPVTGSAALSLPLPASPGRGGTAPTLAVSYDSAQRHGVCGYGWDLPVPQVSRRTDRGLPRYADDSAEPDVFLIDGAEDLVPVDGGRSTRTVAGVTWRVERYRPRVEGAFTRIERWTSRADPADVRWRTISGDNVTTWYGDGPECRIADPADPRRIFAWLVSHQYDDRGNVVRYRYRAEDGAGVDTGRACERHRTGAARSANRYLKAVHYGNRTPYRPVLAPDEPVTPLPSEWLFTLVLDYGDHDPQAPGPLPDRDWECRPDPYSRYRAGFEVRTYRRLHRALMFHRFAELGEAPVLVRALELGYQVEPVTGHSLLVSATPVGYRDGQRAESPALRMRYQGTDLDPTVRTVIRPRAPHLDDDLSELGGAGHVWVDLDGDGVAGVLTVHRGSWYYLRNLSPRHLDGDGGAELAPAVPVDPRPDTGGEPPAGYALLDVDGSGLPDLVRLAPGAQAGYAGRDDAGRWRPLAPFPHAPVLDLAGGEVRLADLTGDGRDDLVVTDQRAGAAYWCASLGTDGFAPPAEVVEEATEQRGPRLLGYTRTETVQLADLTGDGLPDLVRVGNGEVTYRPNLGYGRFGPPVVMDAAPWLDHPERFDPRRVLLADLDGTGTVDLVYLDGDGARLYANHNGDGWGAARRVTGVPGAAPGSRVTVRDLRGTGTACLVWFDRPGPGGGGGQLRYVDLTGGERPHLLRGYENGTGGEVAVEYRPSTWFAQADEQAGRPWPTTLPFPVACAHRTTRTDHVRQTSFTSVTSYHDGYYDPVEREFRGFGRVEVLDTEHYGPAHGDLDQPPVLTRTWFHTGAPAGPAADRIVHTRREQSYADEDSPEHRLPEPVPPAGLTDEEHRQACRALRGLVLRTEVYGLDDGPDSTVPYTTSETTYQVRLLQPAAAGRHAVFQVLPGETIAHHYDRRAGDPRVSHSFVLAYDDLGRPVRTAAVTYPRRTVDPTLPEPVRLAQARTFAAYTELDQTADIDEPDTYRLRRASELRTFELVGLPAGPLPVGTVAATVAAAERVGYEAVDPDGTVAADGPALRLTGRRQVRYLRDDLSGPLPPGQHGRLGLVHHHRALVFTDALVTTAFDGQVDAAELAAAGYAHDDGGWWASSGTELYPPVAEAAAHFYLPVGAVDPTGLTTTVTRDPYDLLVVAVTDPFGRTVRIDPDYHVLGPAGLTDAAGNRAEVAYDARGVVVASALLGPPDAPLDSLDDPTTTVSYDPFAWRDRREPVTVRVRHRRVHGPDNPGWQETVTYVDGAGTVVMAKQEVPPGPARVRDPDTGEVVEVPADPRYVATGRTVLNNKGLPVKQYQPYFSATDAYESEEDLVQVGVTALPRYDPLGRVFRVDLPDGTFTRTDWDPWHTVAYDAADTVRDSTWYAERGSPDPAGPEPADPQQRAAWLSAGHAGTPAVTHTDSLGRPVLAVVDNGGGDLRTSRVDSDLTGGFRRAFDTRGRLVTASVTDLAGRVIRTESAERGLRWSLSDAVGRMVRTWDAHGRRIRARYDALHRPVAVLAAEGDGPEVTLARTVYGDGHPQAAARNLVGQVYAVLDQAGAVVFDRFDAQGNPLLVRRRFTAGHEETVDWGVLPAEPDDPAAGPGDPTAVLAAAEPLLEPVAEETTATAQYDALGRPVVATLPDGTVVQPEYDVAGRLAALRAQVGGQGPVRTFLAGQDYDALGRRTEARYGNGLVTRYAYDPLSLRLTGLVTAPETGGAARQDLRYVYDAAGRVVEVGDAAQQTLFFAGAVVSPRQRFRYDPLGQLVWAAGREHAGIPAGEQPRSADPVGAPLPHPNDTDAVRGYVEEFTYDDLGNLTRLRHVTAAGGGWSRHYRYAHDTDPADRRNRLLATSRPGDPPDGPYSDTYTYDRYGNLTTAPHLFALEWSLDDRLQRVDLGGGGEAYYRYTAAGGRARKVVQRPGGLRTERRYLGNVEIYREWLNGTLRLERRTLHLADEQGAFVQVDTKTVDPDGRDDAPLHQPVARYRYTNHLGSATLETDEDGAVISYEEYHPYGSTAYRSARPGTDLSLKRYRFAGRERDDETGLDYAGARYYAGWLGRWISPDPAGFVDGANLYVYCGNDPVNRVDPTGTESGVREHPVPANPILADPNADPKAVRRHVGRTYRVYADPTWNAQYRMWQFPHPLVPRGAEGDGDQPPDAGGGDGGDQADGGGDQAEGGGDQADGGGDGGDAADGGTGDTGDGGEGGGDGTADGGDGRDTTTPGGQGLTEAGRQASHRNPSGPTLEVPDNYDPDKVRAYRERIRGDRGVGLRSRAPGSRSRTADIRRQYGQLADQFDAANGGLRSRANPVDHTVELQHIIRRPGNFVRPQDHRYLNQSLNSSQGSRAMWADRRARQAGAVDDVPAGAVARSRELGQWRHRPGVRAAGRWAGRGLTVGGTALSWHAASSIDNDAVRTGAQGSVAVEAGATAVAGASRAALATSWGHSARLAAVASGARTVAGVAGGVAQALISGYLAYEDYQRGDWTSFGFNAAAAVGGVALVVGAIIGSPVLIGVGIVTGIAAGVFGLGRALSWW